MGYYVEPIFSEDPADQIGELLGLVDPNKLSIQEACGCLVVDGPDFDVYLWGRTPAHHHRTKTVLSEIFESPIYCEDHYSCPPFLDCRCFRLLGSLEWQASSEASNAGALSLRMYLSSEVTERFFYLPITKAAALDPIPLPAAEPRR
jgi:hypothetical protein